jgi:hypothetical protein
MKIFALVRNNTIIQYPVYEQHIKNKNHLESNYVECVVSKKPQIPKFYYLIETKEIYNNKVYVNYDLKPLSLEALLYKIKPNVLPGENTTTSISDIDSDTIEKIIELTKEYVQSLLDSFAKQKGFDDMRSLVSYKDSIIPEWSAQAALGITKRDTTWFNLYKYLDDIKLNKKPLPSSLTDITENLPSMSWE